MPEMLTELLLVAAFPAAIPALGGVYIFCVILGGGLLVLSTVFGGDADAGLDADVSVDADVDVDLDTDGGAGDMDVADGHAAAHGLSLASWFSIQFVVYFVAVFGLVGTVLTYTTGVGSGQALLWAVLGGLVVGQGVHQLLRILRRTSGDTQTTRRDYVNKLARVTIAITPGQKGEVALQAGGGERFVSAAARHADDRFEIGQQVVVTAFANGTAEVVSRQEYEFITDSKPEGNDNEHDSDRTD